jgi:hypothetical protein
MIRRHQCATRFPQRWERRRNDADERGVFPFRVKYFQQAARPKKFLWQYLTGVLDQALLTLTRA